MIVHVGVMTVSVAEQEPKQNGAVDRVSVTVYVPSTPTVMDCVVAVNPPGPVQANV